MMNNSEKVTFSGAGVIGSSIRDAMVKPLLDPRQRTTPNLATAPLVKLSIGNDVAEIKLGHTRKSVSPPEVVIQLNKLGCLYFRSPDRGNDFGFATEDIDRLLRELKGHGFRLDESCEYNLRVAKTAMKLTNVLVVAVVLICALVVIIGTRKS
jgi:hypothetical protein